MGGRHAARRVRQGFAASLMESGRAFVVQLAELTLRSGGDVGRVARGAGLRVWLGVGAMASRAAAGIVDAGGGLTPVRVINTTTASAQVLL